MSNFQAVLPPIFARPRVMAPSCTAASAASAPILRNPASCAQGPLMISTQKTRSHTTPGFSAQEAWAQRRPAPRRPFCPPSASLSGPANAKPETLLGFQLRIWETPRCAARGIPSGFPGRTCHSSGPMFHILQGMGLCRNKVLCGAMWLAVSLNSKSQIMHKSQGNTCPQKVDVNVKRHF